MRTQVAHMALASVLLAVFALVGSSLLAFTADATRERIAENERLALLENLHAVVPEQRIDNDLFNDTLQLGDPQLLGTSEEVTVYRGRHDGQPLVVAFSFVAPDGYSGRIKLIAGIDRSGAITGVRVLNHHETPGLGDYIELEKSDWILSFNGRSLSDPASAKGWRVKRDGGQFEQFTGATITPRAVVKAVHKALQFVEAHRAQLFPEPKPAPATAPPDPVEPAATKGAPS